MRRFVLLLGAVVPFVLLAQVNPVNPALHAALNGHLQDVHKKFGFSTPFVPTPPTEYRVELTDLNGDRQLEALVLMTGRDWGGTGGQTLFVFRGVPKGFAFISKMTGIRAPMPGAFCIANDRTNGWRDLCVRVSGGGAKAKFVRMRFDGKRYPLNPSVQPPMADWPRGRFVLIHGDATVKALSEHESFFTGLLGKATRLQMKLAHENGKVTGAYFYEKYGRLIQLDGVASANTVRLDEKSGGKVTATLHIYYGRDGWTGQWRSRDGLKQFPLKLTQRSSSVHRRVKGEFQSDTQTTFPILNGQTGQHFNNAIQRKLMARYNDALATRREAFAEFQQDIANNPEAFGQSMLRWSYNDTANLCYWSPDLVSVQAHNYEYTGGAHGNYHDFSLNLWWHGGRVQQLRLENLFVARGQWRQVLAEMLRRELLRREASYVMNGTVKQNDFLQPSGFTLSPAGVEFHYAPYSMGPYAQGSFDVLIPHKNLRPLVRPDGPLARWKK